MTSRTADYAFLHGGGQGSWVWKETIAALEVQSAGGFGRALGLDVPGCGAKRHRPDDSLDNRAIAAELIADIEGAGLTDVVLVGHSQAGQVLPLMADLRPDLFRRLVYVSCAIPLHGQTCTAMMGSAPRRTSEHEVGYPFDPGEIPISDGFPLMFCNDMRPEQIAGFMAKLGRDMWPASTYAFSDWPGDRAGNVPATYVVCLQDNALPAAWQEKFADRFGVERRARIDAGHQVMNTSPHALAEMLLKEA